MQKETKEQKFLVKLEHFKTSGVLPKAVKHGKQLAATKYKCTCELCVLCKNNIRERSATRQSEYKEYFKIYGHLPEGVSHGLSGYGAGCRCEACVSSSRMSNLNYLSKIRSQFKQGVSIEDIGLKHGFSGYNAGCRCGVCKSAHKAQNQKQLAEQRKHLAETGGFLNSSTKHGTHVALKYGCRCEICSKFRSDYSNNYREGNEEYLKKQKDGRQRDKQHLIETGDFYSQNIKHGTTAGYYNGCRCTECKIAQTASYHQKKKEKLSA
ncbi:hypothetical protein D3C78_800580 [compost metagenome]